jgi:hypothetical protein
MWTHQEIKGKYTIRYFSTLAKFGQKKLMDIASKVEDLPRWDKSSVTQTKGKFDFKGEIDSYMGIQYIAFPISDPDGKLAIIIDSRENFEQGVAHFKDLVVVAMAPDGQHRHGKE